MNLYFNRTTLMGQFSNELSPIVIDVPKGFNLYKTLKEIVGEKQSVNALGEPLYIKDVYKEEVYQQFLYNDETLEVTDTPFMESYQKTNDLGEKLYLELIGDDTFETTKAFNEQGEPNTPILLERQKHTTKGEPLYLVPVYEERTRQVYVGEEIVTEWTPRPLLEPIYEDIKVNIINHPQYFHVNEVITEKMQTELERSSHDYLIYNSFVDNSSIDLENSRCNLGVCLLNLESTGYVNFNQIELLSPSTTFTLHTLPPEGVKVYINTKLVVDGKVTLSKSYNNIKVKILNTNPYPVTLNGFGIMYDKEVI